jgi:hypothetical protein
MSMPDIGEQAEDALLNIISEYSVRDTLKVIAGLMHNIATDGSIGYTLDEETMIEDSESLELFADKIRS